ncbi:uncharacterized protein LOC131892548, partial [Tigriopus californicus]|uniref:uncharacterized protein LOC131892548 n=1 Tax=Tigriopus californicus TaxID=6832 RepID=UPI0027D9D3FF
TRTSTSSNASDSASSGEEEGVSVVLGVTPSSKSRSKHIEASPSTLSSTTEPSSSESPSQGSENTSPSTPATTTRIPWWRRIKKRPTPRPLKLSTPSPSKQRRKPKRQNSEQENDDIDEDDVDDENLKTEDESPAKKQAGSNNKSESPTSNAKDDVETSGKSNRITLPNPYSPSSSCPVLHCFPPAFSILFHSFPTLSLSPASSSSSSSSSQFSSKRIAIDISLLSALNYSASDPLGISSSLVSKAKSEVIG